MKVLIQRVKNARVDVEGKAVGQIKQGILAFVGVEKNDTKESTQRMLKKLLSYRIFSDDGGKMNLSVEDINGEILLVSQFTLVANTKKGLRPSFSSAANPKLSEELYKYMIQQAKTTNLNIQTGVFAANMQISLVNDGPVTFNLEC